MWFGWFLYLQWDTTTVVEKGKGKIVPVLN
jgi:hypothetical protein